MLFTYWKAKYCRHTHLLGFPDTSIAEESACNAGDPSLIPGSGRSTRERIGYPPLWLSWERVRLECGRSGFNPWPGKIPWRRERLPTPVFWPGESHGLYTAQKSWTQLCNSHFHFYAHLCNIYVVYILNVTHTQKLNTACIQYVVFT